MADSNQTPDNPGRLTWLWTLIGHWSAPVVYGAAVTVLLGLYFALFRHGDPRTIPMMVSKLALSLTPWFMMGYSAARRIVPDLETIKRPQNLFLPAIEGGLAVFFMGVLLTLTGELRDPYWNFGLDALRLVASVVLARLSVRRVFRH